MSPPPVIVVDNLDSFTFNLTDAFARLGARVRTVRNTAPACGVFGEARASGALVVLSPGPGGPEEAGCCVELVHLCRGRVPVLGVCLGHQVMAAVAGGSVGRALTPVHGKALSLGHDGAGPFRGLPSPMTVGRYHSLCARDLPPSAHVHAEHEGMVMAFSDAAALQVGVQFHPESILTPEGDRLLANILNDAAAALAPAREERRHVVA